MSEAPKVYCPKEGKEVPIWYCLGSFMQQREMCKNLISATVTANKAEVKCKLQKGDKMKIPYAKQKIWNLMMLEKKLHGEDRGNDAFTIRQVLDMISPNWRDVKDYKEITMVIEK